MFEQNTSNSLKEFLYEYKTSFNLKEITKKESFVKMEKDKRGNDK